MPTFELIILVNVSSFEFISMSQSWTPYGFRSASDRMIDSRKQSRVMRSRPMFGHWAPMPVNTYQMGRTSVDTCWIQYTETRAYNYTKRSNPKGNGIAIKNHTRKSHSRSWWCWTSKGDTPTRQILSASVKDGCWPQIWKFYQLELNVGM